MSAQPSSDAFDRLEDVTYPVIATCGWMRQLTEEQRLRIALAAVQEAADADSLPLLSRLYGALGDAARRLAPPPHQDPRHG